MAIEIYAHVKFIITQGSRPNPDCAPSAIGEATLEFDNWYVFGVDCACLSFIRLTKHAVIDWMLLCFKSLYVVLLVFQISTCFRHMQHTRMRNRHLRRGP